VGDSLQRQHKVEELKKRLKGPSLQLIEGQIPVFVVFMSGPITALVEKVFFAIELGPPSDCGENEKESDVELHCRSRSR
jgi:hypothetical protein